MVSGSAALVFAIFVLLLYFSQQANILLKAQNPSSTISEAGVVGNSTAVQEENAIAQDMRLTFPFRVWEIAAGDITANRLVVKISTSTRAGEATQIIIYDLVTGTTTDTLPSNLISSVQNGILYKDKLFWAENYLGDVGVDAYLVGVYVYDLKLRVLSDATPQKNIKRSTKIGLMKLDFSNGMPGLVLQPTSAALRASSSGEFDSEYTWNSSIGQFEFSKNVPPAHDSPLQIELPQNPGVDLAETINDSLDNDFYSRRGVTRVYFQSLYDYPSFDTEEVLHRDLSLSLLPERIQTLLQSNNQGAQRYCFYKHRPQIVYYSCLVLTSDFAVMTYDDSGNAFDLWASDAFFKVRIK